MPYRGRFAPSPTGPLHFGSLVAALGSFLEARARNGSWLVRMEDLDAPRNVPGAADDILRSLDAHGLAWDEGVSYQSTRRSLYAEALRGLDARGLVYACACTRRELADSAIAPDGAAVYPGTCRAGLPPARVGRAVRLRVDGSVRVDDAIQGSVVQNLETDVGDFVLRRADGIYAYQLAAVVDDAAQRITGIVRGADLWWSTPRQVYLQRALGVPTPEYAHLPVVVDGHGRKLSKQTLARRLDDGAAADNLLSALRFLGQDTLERRAYADANAVVAWARARWDPARIPRVAAAPRADRVPD
jgi:glutamyl-Q tRNA(Asp) synthetase